MKRNMRWIEALPKDVKVRVSIKMYNAIIEAAKKQNVSFSDEVRILLSSVFGKKERP
jgi:hypothetical protein